MMHVGTIGRANLSRQHPGIFLKGRRDRNIGVLNRTLRGDFERLGQFENKIRPNVPSLAELYWRRHILSVTLGRAMIGPSSQSSDLCICKALLIREPSVLRIGEPWRHLLSRDRRFNRFRPRAGCLVRQEGHGTDLAGPVANLTVPLKDRKYVLVESRN